MDPEKKKRLEEAGFAIGSADEFLDPTLMELRTTYDKAFQHYTFMQQRAIGVATPIDTVNKDLGDAYWAYRDAQNTYYLYLREKR